MHPLCAPLPMYPITPVFHLDLCIIMAMCPITHVPITPIPITHVPHHPVPYAHVPHFSCTPLPYPHVDPEGVHARLPICSITPVPMSNGANRWWGSKMSNDVNLSKRTQLSKNQITGLWKVHKKEIDIMRFTHIVVNFDITYDGNQKPSKCA